MTCPADLVSAEAPPRPNLTVSAGRSAEAGELAAGRISCAVWGEADFVVTVFLVSWFCGLSGLGMYLGSGDSGLV